MTFMLGYPAVRTAWITESYSNSNWFWYLYKNNVIRFLDWMHRSSHSISLIFWCCHVSDLVNKWWTPLTSDLLFYFLLCYQISREVPQFYLSYTIWYNEGECILNHVRFSSLDILTWPLTLCRLVLCLKGFGTSNSWDMRWDQMARNRQGCMCTSWSASKVDEMILPIQ